MFVTIAIYIKKAIHPRTDERTIAECALHHRPHGYQC